MRLLPALAALLLTLLAAGGARGASECQDLPPSIRLVGNAPSTSLNDKTRNTGSSGGTGPSTGVVLTADRSGVVVNSTASLLSPFMNLAGCGQRLSVSILFSFTRRASGTFPIARIGNRLWLTSSANRPCIVNLLSDALPSHATRECTSLDQSGGNVPSAVVFPEGTGAVHLIATIDTAASPAVHTIWMNGAVVASGFSPVGAGDVLSHTAANAINLGVVTPPTPLTVLDFQVYCGFDLSAANTGPAVASLWAAVSKNGSAPCVPASTGQTFSTPRWVGGPPAVELASRRPDFRYVGGASTFYSTASFGRNTGVTLPGATASTASLVPSNGWLAASGGQYSSATMLIQDGSLAAGNALPVAPPYAFALWFTSRSSTAYLGSVDVQSPLCVGTGTCAFGTASTHAERLFGTAGGPGILFVSGKGLCFARGSNASVDDYRSFMVTGAPDESDMPYLVSQWYEANPTPLFNECPAGGPMRQPYFVPHRPGDDQATEWNHLVVSASAAGYSAYVNGKPLFRPGYAKGAGESLPAAFAAQLTRERSSEPLQNLTARSVHSWFTNSLLQFGDFQVYARDVSGCEAALYYGSGCDATLVTPTKLLQTGASAPMKVTRGRSAQYFTCGATPVHWLIGGAVATGSTAQADPSRNYGSSALRAFATSDVSWVSRSDGWAGISVSAGRAPVFQAPAMYYGGASNILVTAVLSVTYSDVPQSWVPFFNLGNGVQLVFGTNVANSSTLALCLTLYAHTPFAAPNKECPEGSLTRGPVIVPKDTPLHVAFAAKKAGNVVSLYVNGEVAGSSVDTIAFSDAYGNATYQVSQPIGPEFRKRNDTWAVDVRLFDLQVHLDTEIYPPSTFTGLPISCQAVIEKADDIDRGAGIIDWVANVSGRASGWLGPPFPTGCNDRPPIFSMAPVPNAGDPTGVRCAYVSPPRTRVTPARLP